MQEATAADIRLLTAALRVRGELDGHAAHAAVFYLLMTAPAYAVQGVRHCSCCMLPSAMFHNQRESLMFCHACTLIAARDLSKWGLAVDGTPITSIQ